MFVGSWGTGGGCGGIPAISLAVTKNCRKRKQQPFHMSLALPLTS
jgi:hypothetical protein